MQGRNFVSLWESTSLPPPPNVEPSPPPPQWWDEPNRHQTVHRAHHCLGLGISKCVEGVGKLATFWYIFLISVTGCFAIGSTVQEYLYFCTRVFKKKTSFRRRTTSHGKKSNFSLYLYIMRVPTYTTYSSRVSKSDWCQWSTPFHSIFELGRRRVCRRGVSAVIWLIYLIYVGADSCCRGWPGQICTPPPPPPHTHRVCRTSDTVYSDATCQGRTDGMRDTAGRIYLQIVCLVLMYYYVTTKH